MDFIPLCYDILLGCGVYFDYFSSTSFSEVLDLMLASKSSSPIDPLPLSIFHKLSFILTQFILNIINISLNSVIVPSSLKHAIIKHILKKPGLDIECLSNYRPISQLPFVTICLHNRERAMLFVCLNKHSFIHSFNYVYILTAIK